MNNRPASICSVVIAVLVLAVQAAGTAPEAPEQASGPAQVSAPTPGAPAINPDLLTRRWDAQWIVRARARTRSASASITSARRSTCPSGPQRFVVHVTADNRYQLFVNGDARRLGTGARRPEPLALRDGRSRAAPARRQRTCWPRSCGTTANSRRRRRSRGGPGSCSRATPRRSRPSTPTTRGRRCATRPTRRSPSPHAPDARLLRGRPGRAGGRREAPVGMGDAGVRRCGLGGGAAGGAGRARERVAAVARRTAPTGGCSCRGRFR